MKKYLNIILVFTLIVFVQCGNESSDDIVDEFSATVNASVASSTIGEGGGTITFTISLSEQNISEASFTIPFTISGTASENSDFTIDEKSVIIGNNESSASLSITILDDMEIEQNETINLSLGNLPNSLSAGTNTQASVTIIDNDADMGSSEFFVSFGSSTGSTITVDEWTDTGADSYIVLINTEDSFTDLTAGSNSIASTTYIGYGEQVVYNGSSVNAVTVSLLQFSSDYYFKVIPVSSGTFDNTKASVNKSTEACVTTSTTEGQVCFEITSDLRIISSNQLSNHAVGNFPNADPTAIEVNRELDLSPSYTGSAIYVYDETGPPTPMNDNFWQFGIATNGVEFHPMGLKPWTVPDGNANAGEENWEWQAKVTEEGETDLDAYGAHVTSAGNYHYHGDIVGLAGDEDGSRHSLIYGFAADGFPIYYKYGYSDPNDPTSSIVELQSSYQLKSGSRTGTGTAGVDYPGGTHNGDYIQDYEYIDNLGDLDECNGRTGVTPEYPDGTYYYVITSDFPVTPNCFFGTPAEDWKIGN